MFGLFPSAGCNRRQWLKMSALAAGLAGSWRSLAASERKSAGSESRAATANRCIYIFLCGGPSQNDLWDLKPEAPVGIRTLFEPAQTNVPGILFGSLIPKVGQHADKLAVIRSMTHADNNHDTAIAHTLLGQLPKRRGEQYMSRDDHPGLGAIVAKTVGAAGDLPPWVVLPRYFTTSSPPYKGQSAGFLGAAHDPLVFDKAKKGSLSEAPLALDALSLVEGMNVSRLSGRRALQQTLSEQSMVTLRSSLDRFRQSAAELLESPKVRQAFDLEQEPAALRDRYGRNEYGQSFLMARRLAEAGVRFVNVFWSFFDDKGCQFNLWDCHGVAQDVCGIDGQLQGKDQLTHKYCVPAFDQSFSALLEDLSQRGMLEDTLVVVAGEFGRTPKINATAGRDHWAHCYTQLLAGGGIRGGQVYGASDAIGAYVKDAPVTPDDFAATILHAFGVSPETAVLDPFDRPVRVAAGRPLESLF